MGVEIVYCRCLPGRGGADVEGRRSSFSTLPLRSELRHVLQTPIIRFQSLCTVVGQGETDLLAVLFDWTCRERQMEIRVDSLIEGASRAQGTAIIVDVFRAFTTAAIAFTGGADKIILVAEVDEALDLKRRGLGELCMGEVGGIRPEGFDLGNSPFEVAGADVRGKTVIQSTRAGTVGVAAAGRARRIYVCSLVIARATSQAVLRDGPDLVTIVAMGLEGRARTDEDEQCALYLRNLLQGRAPDHDAVRALVLAGEDSLKFDDPAHPQNHPSDRQIALQIDSIPLAIEVRREDGLLVARAEAV